MTAQAPQSFGGSWTDEKLDKVRQYLVAYRKVMKYQRFKLAYIDAFAGTGYRETKGNALPNGMLFPELAEPESQEFLDGSARIALRVEPPFDEYVFIELSESRFVELAKLKEEFPKLADRIQLEKRECNAYLQDICQTWDWKGRRAVLFLDPFGMQVEWITIKAIASTRAIDAFILFPLGMGTNRLLVRNGKIPESWRSRLDLVFGTSDWYDKFYQEKVTRGLFGNLREQKKTCTLDDIAEYYNDRLRTAFEAVADNPPLLRNSTGSPLFLLCFAAANPFGAPIAKKIAQHIFKE